MIATPQKELDPKGVIRESFRIEGLSASEARSIFLGWVLDLPDGVDVPSSALTMLDRYSGEPQGHPMVAVLIEATQPVAKRNRRGGWRARRDG